MEKVKQYAQNAKTYVTSSSGKEMLIGAAVVVVVTALIVGAVVFIQNSGPKIVYQPAIACDLLTKDEAKEMLGEQVLDHTPASPTLSQDVATSKCSYTDSNPEQNQMKVAAIAVRSAVNDQGTEKNKREFAAAKLNQGMQPVNNLGESAFFNPELGQLNILKGRNWIILSYGVGTDPKSNTLEEAIELAQKVVIASQLPTF